MGPEFARIQVALNVLGGVSFIAACGAPFATWQRLTLRRAFRSMTLFGVGFGCFRFVSLLPPEARSVQWLLVLLGIAALLAACGVLFSRLLEGAGTAAMAFLAAIAAILALVWGMVRLVWLFDGPP